MMNQNMHESGALFSSDYVNFCNSKNHSALVTEWRDKKRAWACQHRDKLHYGKGLCSNCYHLAYYHKRRAAVLQDVQEEPLAPHEMGR